MNDEAAMSMDALTFIERLVGHLAWPISIVIVSLIFHRELRSIFSRAKILKVPGVEISLHEEIKEIKRVADEGGVTRIYPRETYDDPFRQAIVENPKWAFLEIWIQLEHQLKSVFEENYGIYRSPNAATSKLLSDHSLTESEANIIKRLSRIRNQIVHGEGELSDADVESLVGTARSMRDRLAQKNSKSHAGHSLVAASNARLLIALPSSLWWVRSAYRTCPDLPSVSANYLRVQQTAAGPGCRLRADFGLWVCALTVWSIYWSKRLALGDARW